MAVASLPAMRRLVASVLGLGLLPRRLWGNDSGAGTLGAVPAAGLSLLLWDIPVVVGLTAALAAIGLALWSAAPFAAEGADPGWVAIDEVAGTLVALIGLRGWPWLTALVVARIGDITKLPPGVAAAEQLPGAVGVTADDVVAGLYGLAIGWILQAVFG